MMLMKRGGAGGGYIHATICFFFIFAIVFLSSSPLVVKVSCQVTDTCSNTLNQVMNNSPQFLFDTSTLVCLPVWSSESFILRYAQTAPSLWSFVLSAPNTNSYIGFGFSSDGNMVGSSAIVGWIASDGTGNMKRYYLTGQTPNQVLPDQGNLQVLSNTSTILSVSSRIYIAFQLNTNIPQTHLLYSVGPNGILPNSPGYQLTQHRDMVSTNLNYASGESTTGSTYSKLKRSHGILNMLGWGIIIPIGAMVARYMKPWDPAWFYSHIIVQSLGLSFGIAGIICGFILNNRLKSSKVHKHKALGIFILSLGCLQVLALLARPDKKSKVRKYWNWYHYSVGRMLIILAAANVFYGIHLGGAGRSWDVGYAIVLGILFILAFVLELRLWFNKD